MEHVLANQSKQQASTVRMLQLFTIGWMCVELSVALFAGIRARSVALTAFGADSGIELLSAFVVLRRFTAAPISERRAARISGLLLYVLAAYILVTSALSFMSTRLQPEPTVLGIGLLIAAAIIMPLLGRAKRKLAAETGSRALRGHHTKRQKSYASDLSERPAPAKLFSARSQHEVSSQGLTIKLYICRV